MDTLMILKAAGLVAASAAGSLIVDMQGGASSGSLGGPAECISELVIDVSALEIDSATDFYSIILQGSPDAAFGTAANIVELVQLSLGHKTARLSDSDKDSTVGRYILPFSNEHCGTTFRYLRLYTVVAGTIVTGINYSAYIAKKVH